MNIQENKQISELIKTKQGRLALSQNSLYLFGLIYFPHYFTFSSPSFHFEMTKLLQSCGEQPNPGDEIQNYYNHLVLCGFRECGKTSWAKIELIRNIVLNLRDFIIYVCYDEEASRDALFDIALELQTNKNILSDFGQLYFEDDSGKSSRAKKKSKKSSISNFLTKNGVRVQASSVKKTVRGRVFAGARPDMYVLDDFENNKTKKSAKMTNQVIGYFEELIPGVSANAKIIYLCNKISDTGSVAYLYDKFEGNQNGKVFEKSLVENGKITWEERFVFTDEEAEKVNKELSQQVDRENLSIKLLNEGRVDRIDTIDTVDRNDRNDKNDRNDIDTIDRNDTKPKFQIPYKKFHRVRSIETLKRTLNKNGKSVFEQEYLNMPMVDGDRLFPTDLLDKYFGFAETQSFEEDGFWKIWDGPQYGHTYVIGADVSEGVGIDSSVIQILDMTTGEQVAEYCNNYCDPNTLIDELISASNQYGKCLICPERNSVGNAVVFGLKKQGYANRMPTEMVFDTVGFKKVPRYGFHTNAKTKPKIIFDLKEAIKQGYLIIKSKPLLRELRVFSNLDTQHHNFDEDISNHFDRVMALAIAWAMRDKVAHDGNINSNFIEEGVVVNSRAMIAKEGQRYNYNNKFDFSKILE